MPTNESKSLPPSFTVAEVDQLQRAFAATMVAKAKQIPQSPTREDILALSPAIPHIEEVANYLTAYLSDEDLITFTSLGFFYQGQGFYQQAETWFQQCTEVAESRLDLEHPNVATSLNNLALLYKSQGRYNEAEPLYLRALAINERSLPQDHPSLATHLNNLAALYQHQGRYSEVEPLYLQALVICQRSLGAEHPNTVKIRQNIAIFWTQAIVEGSVDLEALPYNLLFQEILPEMQALLEQTENSLEE